MSIINSLIKIFVGDKAKNDLKAIQPIVEKIKTYASQLENISNDELRAKTIEFKQRIKDARAQFDNKIAELEAQANATDDIDAKEDLYAEVDKLNGEAYQASEKALNEILPEAFATMKETTRRFANNETITVTATEHDRELSATHDYVTIEGDKAVWKNHWDAAGKDVTWDMVHYDVQLIGGIALHQGKIAEMQTGEGKTLVATLPVYLNALTGKGSMLVTTNDYLARRDASEMGPVYQFLGLTVGLPFSEDPKEDLTAEEKRKIYTSDIVYTTNSVLGFDYLNDNLASTREGKFLPPFNYVIIDEIDDILLDSAQTPLIIAGSPRVQSNYYGMIDTLVTTLVEGEDYIYKEEKDQVWLTRKGAQTVEAFLGIDHLYKEEYASYVRHLVYALRAHTLFTKDKDYLVRGQEMVLLDKGTGRLMEMTKLQGGLHQAIEAKEHVKLTQETRAMASITYQNLFRLFRKLSGMTGTGKVVESEFLETYSMSVVKIPTNCPVIRRDYPDQIYQTLPEKVFASLDEVKHYHAKGNPLLIFTGSVEMSETDKQPSKDYKLE